MSEQHREQPQTTPQEPRPAHGHDLDAEAEPPVYSPRRVLLVLVIVLAVAGALALLNILPRLHARTALADETRADAIPTVVAVTPAKGSPVQEIVLPGNIQAYTDSPIYARTSGYLKKWYFDIGGHVRKGQLLAEIESPEVDQQLAQARADLVTAETNAGNARTQSARYQDLLKSDAVSKLDTDNFVTQANAGNAQVKSAQANMQRLEQLVAFEKVYAPFDGVVTARNVDTGQLINSGAGVEMFHLAAINTLRVYVNVPQAYTLSMKRGTQVALTFQEYPGRSFPGTLVRTSNQIDPTSRTLLVEVDVDNRKGELLPGAYAQVHFKVSSGETAFVVPVSALIFRSAGLRVAQIVDGNKAKLMPVVLGRDDGRTVEVVHGLDPGAQVIQDPPDSLVDGEEIQIAKQPSTGGAQK